MEFWGVEVKAGQRLKVQPESGRLIHISQAALGEVKDAKAAKYVPLKLKVDSRDFIIGSLAAEERPQLMFDLVFELDFELSHDWKNGSVYFLGYTADDQEDPYADNYSSFSDESEDEPVDIPEIEIGKVPAKSEDVKDARSPAAAGKTGAKKEEQPDSDEDEDGNETSSSEDEGSMDLNVGDYEDSDESDEEEEEEEELPKVQQSKKRPAEPVQKTPVPAKKAKGATTDKTGNKKGQASTPFPSKGGNKSNGQGPKSGGFKGGPKSGGFKGGPKSGGFKGGPKSGGFKGKDGGKGK